MRRPFTIAAVILETVVLATALIPGTALASPATVASNISGTVPGDVLGYGHDNLTDSGWTPAPSQPYDQPAGARCDFALHVQPIHDEVRFKVLATNPDGSSKLELYTGALVLRITNADTGASVDADASGTALIEYGADGSMTWYVVGPVLIGFKEGGGTLPRGLWVIDGVFRLSFSSTGFKTLTMVSGHTENVCDRLA